MPKYKYVYSPALVGTSCTLTDGTIVVFTDDDSDEDGNAGGVREPRRPRPNRPSDAKVLALA